MSIRPRRILLITVLVLLGVVLLAGVASAVVLLGAAGDLKNGRDALRDARRALVSGHAEDAADAFAEAGVAFASAAHDVGGPLGSFAGAVPGLGNHVDLARSVSDAGIHVSAAGGGFAEALATVPGGLGGLVPEGGRLPVERYGTLAEAAADAGDEAALALEAIEAAPSTFLVRPVLQERWDLEADLREATEVLEASALLLEGMPGFAGADGPRRYLVVSENPAELRGTGGLWGAYAILTLRDGRATVGTAAATQSLPAVEPNDVPAPSPDYRRIYDRFGGAASWHNLNMTPDFPSAARAALGNYAAGGGGELDGVIAADPFALSAMLEETGPVPVPGTGIEVDARSVVAFTASEAYSVLTVPDERKEVLGGVAAGVMARFLALDGRPVARMRAIGEAVSGGHLKVYVPDEGFAEGLDLLDASGAYAPRLPGDMAAVHVNNGSGNKVDAWAIRRVDYEVRLGGDAESVSTLSATIANEAPTSGYPKYVLGPKLERLGPGDQLPLITASCHAPCELLEARRDGEPVSVTTDEELGIPWYRDHRPIAAGEAGSFSISWRSRGAWEGTLEDGRYRLTFLGQTTIEPTELRVRIESPPGTSIVWANEPMRIEGAVATWRGTPRPRTMLEIRFRAPTPLRWWRSVTGG
jgi:hypothetical protein